MDGPEKPPAPAAVDTADAAPPRRRDRWWHWLVPLAAVVVPLGLLGGVGYLLWSERTAALQLAFPYISSALGWDTGAATVHEVGPKGLRLSDVSLGHDGAITADNIDVRFTPADLLDRRVNSIAVDGLHLEARFEDGRLVLPLPEGGDVDVDRRLQWPTLPFEKAVLSDVSVGVETPQGPVALSGKGLIEADKPDSAKVDLEVALAGPAEAGGTLRLSGRASDAGGDAIALSLIFETDAAGFGLSGDGSGSLSATVTNKGVSEAVFALDDIDLSYPVQSIEVKGLSGNGTVLVEGRTLREAAIDLNYQSLAAIGQELTPGRLALTLDNGALAIETMGATPWATVALTAAGRIDDPEHPVQFTLRGDSEVAPLIASAALPLGGSGEFAFDVAGSVRDPLGLAQARPIAPIMWLDALTMDGRLDLDIADFSVGDNIAGGAATGALTIDVRSRSATVQAPDGITLAMDQFPIGMPETDIDGLQTALDGPITLILGGDAGTRPILQAAPADPGYDLTFDGGFLWPEIFDGLSGELSVALAVDEDLRMRSFEMPFLLAKLEGLAHNALSGTAEVLLSDVEGGLDSFSGQASLGVQSGGGKVAGVAFGETELEIDSPFAFDGEALVLSLREGSRLDLSTVTGPNGIETREPLTVTLADNANEIRLLPGGSSSLDITLAPLKAGLTVGAAEQEIDVSLGSVTVAKRNNVVDFSFAESEVAIPGQPVRIAKIVGQGEIDATGRPSASVTVGDIRHTATPAFVVPLQLNASVSATETGGLRLAGELSDRSGRLSFSVSGTHERKSGEGEVSVTMKPLMFLPTVLQPKALFPVAQGRTEMVDGDVALSTSVRWGDGGLASPADLTVTLRELTTSELRLANVVAEVRFDQLFPPITPPGQEIKIGLAEVGVPLTDGRVVFEIKDGIRILAQLRELDMFGGLLNSEPFEYTPGMDPFTVVLTANGVRLEELLALAELGEISASGTLSGVVPITLENGEVAVRGAKLRTGSDGGILRYKPKDIGPTLQDAEFSTGLFLQAVENFHYRTVEVTLDEGEAEDLLLGIHLEGKNPDLYGGAPFELNVNLEGPLRALLDRGIRTYTLPDRIREQVVDIGG